MVQLAVKFDDRQLREALKAAPKLALRSTAARLKWAW